MCVDSTYEVSLSGVASPTLRAAFMECEVNTGVGATAMRCKTALRTVNARTEELGLERTEVRLIAGSLPD